MQIHLAAFDLFEKLSDVFDVRIALDKLRRTLKQNGSGIQCFCRFERRLPAKLDRVVGLNAPTSLASFSVNSRFRRLYVGLLPSCVELPRL